MIKSSAVLLGFLFGLSILYYLSYWTYFDIDIFQYIAVTDIIKGVAYPLRFATGVMVGFVVMVGIVLGIAAFIYEKALVGIVSNAFWALLGISIILAVLYFAYLDSYAVVGVALSLILSMVLALTYYIFNKIYIRDLATARVNRTVIPKHVIKRLFNGLSLYLLIFLPVNALIIGQVDARAVHTGRRFNYILISDLQKSNISSKYSYLLFLGAVSEKYIFIEPSEGSRFIIDKSELTAFRIHHYSETDEKSKIHFEECVHPKHILSPLLAKELKKGSIPAPDTMPKYRLPLNIIRIDTLARQ